MAREVDEWIGRTDDSPVPPHVKLRVFERANGMCHISGRKIRAGEPWDCDHILALCNGGQNREGNLAPALKDSHKAKTAVDVAQRAKDDRVRKKHLGIYQPKGRPMPTSRKGKYIKHLDGSVSLRGE